MSTASPVLSDTRHLPVLLAKIGHAGHLGWISEDPADRSETEDVALNLASADMVTLTDSDVQWYGTSLTLSNFGAELARHATPAILTGGDSSVGAAMWLWLFTHGKVPMQWSEDAAWGRNGELWHTLTCGIDLAASSPVRDSEWTSMEGTYAPSDRHVGVSGRLTCRCGQVAGVEVAAEIGSIADMLRELLNQPH